MMNQFLSTLESIFVPPPPPVAGVSANAASMASPASMPVNTAPQGDNAVAAALKILGQGGKQKEAEQLLEVLKPKDRAPQKRNWQDFLFETGLGMMAAGGQPGATLLGAAGEGALSANKSERRRMREQERLDLLKEGQERDALKSVMALLGDQTKTEFSQGMAEKQFGLSKDRLAFDRDMGMKRLALAQSEAGRGRYQILQTPQGTFRINIDTGAAEPVMAGDTQLPGKDDFSTPAAMTLAAKLVEGSQFSDKPMDFGGAMNEVMNQYNSAKAQRSVPSAAGGATPAENQSLPPMAKVRAKLKEQGASEEQIKLYLQKYYGSK